MKNPQQFSKGRLLLGRENAIAATEARTHLRRADFALDNFGLRGMGQLPNGDYISTGN